MKLSEIARQIFEPVVETPGGQTEYLNYPTIVFPSSAVRPPDERKTVQKQDSGKPETSTTKV